MNQLIRCVKCDEVFLRTPFDQWPEYELSQDPSMDSLRTIKKDDFGDFLRNHRGHRLEDLKIIEESYVGEKDYKEPVKTSYFRATNGKDRFLIKKSRDRIDEPLKYEVIPGDLSLRCTSLEIQAKAIARQLEKEFEATPLPQAEIIAFVRLCQRIVEQMDVGTLERIPEESAHPLEVYFKMDDISLAFLLRNCRNIFKGREYQEIEEFIHRHKDDGVLLVKGTFQIGVMEAGKSRGTAVSPPMAARKAAKKEET